MWTFPGLRLFILYIQLQFDIALFVKQSSGFRQIFKVPTVEWCALMSRGKSSNRMTRSLIRVLKQICPQVIQSCPYLGRYELVDVKFDKNTFFMYPAGLYRITTKVTDDASKTVVNMSVLMEFI